MVTSLAKLKLFLTVNAEFKDIAQQLETYGETGGAFHTLDRHLHRFAAVQRSGRYLNGSFIPQAYRAAFAGFDLFPLLVEGRLPLRQTC
jgi:hypothetical protein